MNKTVGKIIAWILIVGITASVMSPIGVVGKSVAARTETRSSLETRGDCGETFDDNGFCACGNFYQPAIKVTVKEDEEVVDTYYEISNAGQLYWFAGQININAMFSDSGLKPNTNAKLVDDIVDNEDLLDEDGKLTSAYADAEGNVYPENQNGPRRWQILGLYTGYGEGDDHVDTTVGYAGEFDGQGHTISGLYSDKSEAYQGLFGTVGSYEDENYQIYRGSVKNVKVIDSCFIPSQSVDTYVGGITAICNGGEIENCSFQGTLYSDLYVGGIVGRSESAAVNNCGVEENSFISGEVSTNLYSRSYVGGIVGENFNGCIDNCYNKANVSDGKYIGGITATSTGSSDDYYIKNSYNTGIITSQAGSANAGGIVGSNSGTNITGCYNKGNVSAESAGGIVASNYDSNIVQCYNTADITGYISGDSYIGGIVGSSVDNSASSIVIDRCYNTGNISNSIKVVEEEEVDVTGQYIVVAGICGYTKDMAVTNCYNAGDISNTFIAGLENYIGGIVADNYGTISYCHNVGKINDGEDAGAIAGITEVDTEEIEAGKYAVIDKRVTNCYYLDTSAYELEDTTYEEYLERTSSNGIKKTAQELASGAVTFSFNSEQNVDDVWYQNLSGISGITPDAYPVLDGTHGTVIKDGDSYVQSIDSAVVVLEPVYAVYDGNDHTPRVTVKLGDSELDASLYDVEYYNSSDSKVNSGNIKEKDTYTVKVIGKGSVRGTATASYTISEEVGENGKMNQTAPILNKTDETIEGMNDGTIYPVYTSMEYRLEGESNYNTIESYDLNGSQLVKAAGTYYIRYKETSTHNASPDTKVVVESGDVLTFNCSNNDDTYTKGTVAGHKFTTSCGEGFDSLVLDSKTLSKNTNYTISGNDITIKQATLDELAAGTHTVTITYISSITGTQVKRTCNFTVEGATQNAPGLTDADVVDETFAGWNDGYIKDVTTAMEYKSSRAADSEYKKVTVDMLTNASDDGEYKKGNLPLAPGEYDIRYAATDIAYASSSVTLEVEQGDNIQVTPAVSEYTKMDTSVTGLTFTINVIEEDLTPSIAILDGSTTYNLAENEQYTIVDNAVTLKPECLDYLNMKADDVEFTFTFAYENPKNPAKKATGTANFTVHKATRNTLEASTFSVTDENLEGFKDGSISGVTTDMEYDDVNDTENGYVNVDADGTLANLAAGKYIFRYKATNIYKASNTVEVEVGSGGELTFVQKPETTYVKKSVASDVAAVTFKPNVWKDDTNVSVKLGEDTLTKGTHYFVDETNKTIYLKGEYVDGLAMNSNSDTKTFTLTLNYANPHNTENSASVSANFTVEKATRSDKPTVTTTDETYEGFEDGAFTITNIASEIALYRKTGAESYTEIVGAVVTNIASGTYEVVFKATDLYKQSGVTTVNIVQGSEIQLENITVGDYKGGSCNEYEYSLNVYNSDAKFYMDEMELPSDKYTVTLDYTNNYTVTLNQYYMDTLTMGNHTFKVVFDRGSRPSKSKQLNVVKDTQEKPTGLSGTNETVKGFEDGTISGLTTAMEYRSKTGEDTWSTWKVVDGDKLEAGKMLVPAGTYEVRFAETDTKAYSEAVEVKVEGGVELKFTPDSATYTKLSKTGDEEGVAYEPSVNWNASYTPELKLYESNVEDGGEDNDQELVKDTGYFINADNKIFLKASLLNGLSMGAEDSKEYKLILSYTCATTNKKAEAVATFTINKATKTKPEANTFTVVNESIAGFKDGSISGFTTAMEYDDPNDESDNYIAIKDTDAGKLENLSAGDYKVRYKADNNYKTSEATTITVDEGEVLEFRDSTASYTKKGSNNDTVAAVTFEPNVWKDNDSVSVKLGTNLLTKGTDYKVDTTEKTIYLTEKYVDALVMDADTKTYTLTLSYANPNNTENGATASADFTVNKATRTVQNVGKTDETYKDFNDGIISNVTTEMQYKLSTATNYTDITATSITGLKVGTYKVRYKATNIYRTSEDVDVTIAQGTVITLTEPSTSYTIGATQNYDPFTTNYNGTGDNAFDRVATFYVDNVEVPSNKYSVSGNELTLANDYLDTLTDGEHTLKAKFNKGAKPEAICKFEVEKLQKTAPSESVLVPTDESFKGFEDGKIAGLDNTMEYRVQTGEDTWSEWIKVTDEDMTFPEGTYEIRYGEDATHEASSAITVTIKSGEEITVQASKDTFTLGDKEGIVFTINADYDKFASAKINNTVLVKGTDYNVVSGSTIITISPDYLNNLSAGDYTFKAYYNPEVEVTYNFKVVSNTTTPDDDDSDGGDTGNTDDDNEDGTIPDDDKDSDSDDIGDGTTNGDDMGSDRTDDGITDNGNIGSNDGNANVNNNNNNNNNTDDNATNSPGADTGDDNNLVYWEWLMILAVVGITGTVIYTKKKQEK